MNYRIVNKILKCVSSLHKNKSKVRQAREEMQKYPEQMVKDRIFIVPIKD